MRLLGGTRQRELVEIRRIHVVDVVVEGVDGAAAWRIVRAEWNAALLDLLEGVDAVLRRLAHHVRAALPLEVLEAVESVDDEDGWP